MSMSEVQQALHYKEVGRGNYQTAEDYLAPDGSYRSMTLTLDYVELRDFENDKGKHEKKAVLHFQPTRSGKQPLPMVLGKEAWQTVAGMAVPVRGELVNNPDPKGPSWRGFRITFSCEVYRTITKGHEAGTKLLGIRPKGSPDIPADMSITIQLFGEGGKKRKPFTRRVTRTPNGGPPTSRSPKEPQ